MTLSNPFAVDPMAVTRLGPAFTDFVNSLLDAERAQAGITGWQLRIDTQENTPDGGVDAVLLDSMATDWLPQGTSAWQFKGRRTFSKADCVSELEGAAWALEILRNGGSYILAASIRWGGLAIENREKALREKAAELGIDVSADPFRIRVVDANLLARWSSEFPSLAVSGFFNGPGGQVISFDEWTRSSAHTSQWIDSAEKVAAIGTIHERLSNESNTRIRVQGDSGLGKTRLVMEALRNEEWRSVVAYLPQSENLGPEVLPYLLSGQRVVIVVADECDARDHDKLAERIPDGSPVKLITIGESSTYPLLDPVVPPGKLEPADVERYLVENFPELWDEARRLVAEYCDGNVRFAHVIARRIRTVGRSDATDLIRRGDLETFVSGLLPEGGRSFFLCSLLSLAERVGWEGDVAHQLEALATFAGADVAEMREAGAVLKAAGLLTEQGRYRAVSPKPVAVVLAASAWRERGTEVLRQLFPLADREMALSILRRGAQLGTFAPTAEALQELMSPSGPLGSLEIIEDQRLAEFLIELAIVSPDMTASFLSSRIRDEALEQLKQQSASRRGIVWALEKLAWHTRTFESSADSLLRLSLAENESYGNNATGTWEALFGAGLPATAALPGQRLDYLRSRADSSDPAVRAMVVKACARALTQWESATVSAEIQGGVVVEPRGRVTTLEEQADYRLAAIEILRGLLSDSEPTTAKSAAEALIACVHPLIDDVLVGPGLMNSLVELPGDRLDELRQSLTHLHDLFERHQRNESVEAAIGQLEARLPELDSAHELRLLLRMSPWELEHGRGVDRVPTLLNREIEEGRLPTILSWLGDEEVPSAWFAGRALADLKPETDSGESAQYNLIAACNPSFLGGFLAGQAEAGFVTAFDIWLDRALDADALPIGIVLSLTVQGPATESAEQRVRKILPNISVFEGTRRTLGWNHKVDESALATCLKEWIPRVESQSDYEALVDWVGISFNLAEVPILLRESVWQILLLRQSFPELANGRYLWCQLARQFLAEQAEALGSLLLDLVEKGVMILNQDEESALLRELARSDPRNLWGQVAIRLEGGSWRLGMHLRGWFTDSIPSEVISEWIGESSDRAKVAAEIASAGSDAPTPLARLLLDKFADVDEVGSSLAGEFLSGGWTGPASARYSAQIAQLDQWCQSESEPANVKRWAERLKVDFLRMRDEALQREAEGGF